MEGQEVVLKFKSTTKNFHKFEVVGEGALGQIYLAKGNFDGDPPKELTGKLTKAA